MTRNPNQVRRAAIVLALGAAGLWGWIFATGGVVRRPPPKLDRPARAAAAAAVPAQEPASAPVVGGGARATRAPSPDVQSAARPEPDADPRTRLDALARRLDALEAARAPQRDALDAAFAGAPNRTTAAEPELDAQTAAFLASAPFEGVRARAGLRVASFGGRLFVEGDELVPGALRLSRVDASGVVLAGPRGDVRLALPAPRTEGAR
ncbi:MAG: hypothetical protein IPJ77_12290 [Planctomycetes bacterium]|nr:hypothetical protein [Planctomycetota bacterium]